MLPPVRDVFASEPRGGVGISDGDGRGGGLLGTWEGAKGEEEGAD